MRNFIKNKEGKVNKKLAIPLAILVVIGLGVTIYAISAYFASLQVTATVNEPVFVSNDNGNNYVPLTSNIQLTAQASSVYPGESTTLATIYVENKASVNEPVYLTMTNTANTVDGANWATNGNGYLLDGSAIMIAPGFHTIVVTTAYNGQMNGAELQATIMIGGTLQAQPVVTPSTASVNLGTAGNFAILSETGITDANPSVVTGNVGTSPISGASILLSCSEVTGTIYDTDNAYVGGFDSNVACRTTDATALTTAVGDMGTAYTTANGLTAGTTELNAGNIGGLTITPGIYKWSSDVTIPTSVTLDAQGNSSAVFVFQVSGKLDLASAQHITLSNGAQANNVYWIVAGTTTLGTTSVFNGNILDKTDIVMQTGATLNGKALSQTAVTMDTSTVNN